MSNFDRPANFARLFLAPGVTQHGLFAPGPAPDDPLSHLVQWVENGKASVGLNGVIRDASTSAVAASRPICAYPEVVHYIEPEPRQTPRASRARVPSPLHLTSAGEHTP